MLAKFLHPADPRRFQALAQGYFYEEQYMASLWTDLSLPFLAPGLFVRLEDQPEDMPNFVLDYCKGDRCWIRQQSWGPTIHWGVSRSRLQPAE